MAEDSAKKAVQQSSSGEPPSLTVDEKLLGFGLKGGGGLVKGGLRSPLVGGGEDQAAAASPVRAAPMMANTAMAAKDGLTVPRSAGSMREISEIKGLSVVSHQISDDAAATHISHIMYDPAPARMRRTIWLLLLIAAVVGAGYLAYAPKERHKVQKMFRQGKNALMEIARPQQQQRKKKRRSQISNFPTNGPQARPLPVGVTRRTCGLLVVESSSGSRLSLGERVDLAECFTVQGDFVSAEGALKPIAGRITGMSEAELNRVPASRSPADAYQLLVATLLKEGKSQEASRLLGGKCIKWEQSNTCVAKAMVFADRHLASPGMDILFASQNKLDRKAQARVMLAGATMALGDDKQALAHKRFGQALAAAPKDALALRKTIYEAKAVDLFHRGDVRQLQATVNLAMAELKPTGSEGKMKLKILLDLATAPDRVRRTREMLTREEVTFRARRDFDLIDIFGPESLKAGLEADYLRLLKRTREFYDSKYKATDRVGRKLAVWEIRATISSGDNERALVMTHGYDRAYGADAFSRHMRGVAYHLASPHERYQFLAAQEFQGALRLSRNWESLYALGVTLVRSGRQELVAAVIKDLDVMTSTKGQRFWADMLKAEWYLAARKLPAAESVLKGWIQEKPGAVTPRRLLIKVLDQAERSGDSLRAEQGLAELMRTERYHGSKESLASPLGPMALGKRPLE